MDANCFDVLTRSLTGGASRRGLVAGLGGNLLALPFLAATGKETMARNKRRKDKNKRDKKNEKKPAAPLCASPPPPGQAQPQVAGGCEAVSAGATGLGIGARLAQTFVAGHSGTLHQIRMPIHKEAGSTGNYVVQLVAVSAGYPAHAGVSVYAASTIDNADVGNGDTTLVANFAGTSIVAGQAYAVIVTRLDEGKLLVHIANGTACPNSAWFYAFGENSFSTAPNADMIVSVLVV